LITTPDLGEHIGGAILFEETLYQSSADGTSFVDALNANGIYPGIKVDKVSVNVILFSAYVQRGTNLFASIFAPGPQATC